MFKFSKLFNAGDILAGFDAGVIQQAEQGCVCPAFARQALVHAIVVPLKKEKFDKFCIEFFDGATHPFKGVGAAQRGRDYAQAFAAIRAAMPKPLPPLPLPSWAEQPTPTPKTAKATKATKANKATKATNATAETLLATPTPATAVTLSMMLASLSTLTVEELQELQAGIVLASDALGYEFGIVGDTVPAQVFEAALH